jgi:hypothetical protein
MFMKQNLASPGPTETSLIIQACIEGLNPQQVLARDLLVKFLLEDHDDATEYVERIGIELSAVLKEVLVMAADVRDAYITFQMATGTVHIGLDVVTD